MLKRIEVVLTAEELALAERLCAEENAERKAEGLGRQLSLRNWLGGIAGAALGRRLMNLAEQSENAVLSAAPTAD